MLLFSLVGIRDADCPGATFPLLGNRTEDRALKFVAPESLLRIQVCQAPGWSVGARRL